MTLKSHILRPHELAESEIELWRLFASNDPLLDHPFFSHAFVRAVGRVHPRVFVTVVELGGSVAGFFPFQFSSGLTSILRSGERVGGDLSDRFGIIAGPDLPLDPEQLLRLSGLSSIEYSFLPKNQARFGLVGQRLLQGQQVSLDCNAADFWTDLKKSSRKFTSQVDRNERILASEFGPLSFSFVGDDPNELIKLVEAKRDQHLRTSGEDPLRIPWKLRLLRELMELRDPQCGGVLSTLYAGRHWLASHFGLASQGVFHYWFPVYNIEFARFSPGNVLAKHLLLFALSKGIRYFDLGRESDYKSHFRPQTYEFGAGYWHSQNWAGYLAQVVKSIEWRISPTG